MCNIKILLQTRYWEKFKITVAETTWKWGTAWAKEQCGANCLRNTSFFQMNFKTWKDCLCESTGSNREAVSNANLPQFQIASQTMSLHYFPSWRRLTVLTVVCNAFEGKGLFAEFCHFPCVFSNHSHLQRHGTTKNMPSGVPGVTPDVRLHPFGCQASTQCKVLLDWVVGIYGGWTAEYSDCVARISKPNWSLAELCTEVAC